MTTNKSLNMYSDLRCPFCEHGEIRVLPVRVLRLKMCPDLVPLANCLGCGLVFLPPDEVWQEKREQWSKAIKRTQVTAPPKKVERSAGVPKCQKYQKRMSARGRSHSRGTYFTHWVCKCGHEWLEKNNTGRPSLEEEKPDDDRALSPQDIPEMED